MRVLHIIDSLRAAEGGPSFAVREMARRLEEAGLASPIACRLSDADAAGGRARFPEVSLLPGRTWASLVRPDIAGLGGLISDADIVHVHGVWDPLLLAASRLAAKAGKPLVCTPHGMLAPWSMARRWVRKWPYYRALVRPMLSRAAAFHFITRAEADSADRWLPTGAASLVVPIILSEEFYGALTSREDALNYFPQIPGGGPWVLFLSRIHPKKGLPRLISAFPAVLGAFPKAQLVIAGSGDPSYVAEMRRLADGAGIAGSAHFVGPVSGPAKVALYRRAAILAVPSSQENFGMVFAESLACSTPVLLTPQVDLHHEIMAVGAGFLAEANPAAVAGRLVEAMREPARLEAAGKAGRRWVLEYLRPETVAKQMVEAYESILSGARGVPYRP
jgi:glycosyltransferase involved in cell wall biosynthesis